MLLAYVDESYDRDFYYIAAAIAPQDVWDQLETALDGIRTRTVREHGLPADVELHGHEIMGGKGEWGPLRGKHREAAGIYAAALTAARDAGVKYVFRGVDIARLNARYKYPDQPHGVVFGHLLERINEHAVSTRETDQVVVIADEIATQEDHRRQFEGYRLSGTPGYRSSTLSRISSPINFASSRLTPGLQVVDLAAYLHHRRNTTVESHRAARATVRRLSALVDATTVHNLTWEP
jgi:hypothetical protein